MRNSGRKTGTVLEHTKSAGRFVVLLRLALIFNIRLFRNIAQIFKPIVGTIAVNVVNLTNRPISGHVQPHKPVALVDFLVYGSDNVPIGSCASSNGTLARSRLFQSTDKVSGFGAIVENFFESCLCKHSKTLTQTERA